MTTILTEGSGEGGNKIKGECIKNAQASHFTRHLLLKLHFLSLAAQDLLLKNCHNQI